MLRASEPGTCTDSFENMDHPRPAVPGSTTVSTVNGGDDWTLGRVRSCFLHARPLLSTSIEKDNRAKK